MATSSTLTDADRARVGAAVESAEALSSGEIVTVLADRSDGYSDIALAWSAVVALVVLALLAIFGDAALGFYDGLTGGWAHEWTPHGVFTFAAIAVTLGFALPWLLQLAAPVRFALIPGPAAHARVRGRAIDLFKIGADQRTTGRTGVLIYLSLRERRAEIVADQAIAAKVPAEVWGEAMAAMLPHLRGGRVADGLCDAIARVGDVLAEQFPRSANDVNELPDRLIEL